MKKILLFLILMFGMRSIGSAQTVFQGFEHLFSEPAHYQVSYIASAPVIDGDIHDPVWDKATWTSLFVDILGSKQTKPYLDTRIKMLWSDSYLFIAADLKDPHVWATLKNHDDIVFRDNDFEVFLDPKGHGRNYVEIEVNAFNTIFDLLLPKPYRDRGKPDTKWNVQGLLSAVKIQGTLNNPKDQDSGWTVEMAIPFKAKALAGINVKPAPGDVWRANFSRVHWETNVKDGIYHKKLNGQGKPLPEQNWVWSPQGVINMHYPERWGYLQFVNNEIQQSVFKVPDAAKQQEYLWLVYYKQRKYRQDQQQYAKTLEQLGFKETTLLINGRKNRVSLMVKDGDFICKIEDEVNQTAYSINDEGEVQSLK